MSVEDKHKALVRRFHEEAWNKGNVGAVDEFMAADYVDYPIPSGLPPGTEGLKQAITTYRTAFPDLKATVDDIFAEGNRVAYRWSTRGTHLGDWLGIPPTGNHMAATGIIVFRIAGGKVVEGWTCMDLSPTDEELRWLTEGGGWPRSGDIPSTERDPGTTNWDVLTRNLTWRLRVAQARERERIEQELQVDRRTQEELLPKALPELDGWEFAQYYQPAREVGGDFYDYLTSAHVRGLYREKRDAGLSPRTVQYVHVTLHKALKQAIADGLIPRNATEPVKPPQVRREEMRPLTAQQARILFDAAKGDRLEALYVLAVTTGLRQGELLGLKWDDIDLEVGTLQVRRTLTTAKGGPVLSAPKTKGSRRTVKLSQTTLEALRSHLKRQLGEIDRAVCGARTV